jgi:precorrin-3B synthase
LTLHEAADGLLARVRLPGGLVSGEQLVVLADLADAHGDGRLELTSRGNLQLRGLADGEISGPLAAAGLLPSATHERVRNIVASPLSGLDGSPDVTGTVRELDRELCARPGLAELPGRFLFAVDDGRGDTAGLAADITLLPGAAVADALAVAEQFLAVRAAQGSAAWRIAELDGGGSELTSRPRLLINSTNRTLGRALGAVDHRAGDVGEIGGRALSAVDQRAGDVGQTGERALAAVDHPVGVVGEAAVLLVALGRLDSAQARWLAAHDDGRGLRITPWRSVVVPGLGELAEAETLGFGVDAASPWYRVSACTGRPGCARALADVQADARSAALRWPGRRVRWSGCERRCGRPRDTEIDVIATANGYAVV